MRIRNFSSAWMALACVLIATAASADAPSLKELAASTFTGIYEEPITLVDGNWQGKPFDPEGSAAPSAGLFPDFRLTGDLNGDAVDEAVAMLWFSGGGTGNFSHLVVAGRENGKATQLGIAAIGDRVQVRAARIEDARIVVDSIQAGPDDPACCPSRSFQRVWELSDRVLREVSSEDRGPASPQLLEAVEWRLDAFSPDDPTPAGIEVTLRTEGDRVAGKSGCNRYSASISTGEGPMTLGIGPAMGTRMACASEIMEVERRYLEALSRVESFGFTAGRLALSWSHDDRYGTLVFSPRHLPND